MHRIACEDVVQQSYHKKDVRDGPDERIDVVGCDVHDNVGGVPIGNALVGGLGGFVGRCRGVAVKEETGAVLLQVGTDRLHNAFIIFRYPNFVGCRYRNFV